MIWLLLRLGLALFLVSLCAGIASAESPVAGSGSSSAAKPPPKAPESGAPAAQSTATPSTAPAASAMPKQDAAKVVGQFGDWALCGDDQSKENDKSKPAACSLVQQLVEQGSKKSIFRFTIGYGPRGNLVLVVNAPLGMALDTTS